MPFGNFTGLSVRLSFDLSGGDPGFIRGVTAADAASNDSINSRSVFASDANFATCLFEFRFSEIEMS